MPDDGDNASDPHNPNSNPLPPVQSTSDAAAFLASIVECADDAIITEDLDGKITSWNRAAERMFGYSATETIGRPVVTLFPAEEMNGERARLARIQQGERVEHFETVRVRKDGSRIEISLRVSPVRNAEGRVIGLSKIARDLTEQKRANEMISQLRLIIDAAPNGMVLVDRKGVMKLVNAQMERLFGYTREEMLGQRIEVLLPERYRSGHPGQRDSFFHSPEVRSMGHGRDLFARRKDGTEFPVEVGLNPAETPEGMFVLAAVIDITARKRAEDAAKKSAAQLQLVVEAAPNGMVMVDKRGTMVMANAQMERLFGYSRQEMLGQSIEMLLPERYRAGHPTQRQTFFGSPETRSMGHGRDLFARRKDGTEFPVEVGLNPAETPDGTFVLAAVIDITQRKGMEAELAKAHAALTDRARSLEATVAERTAHLHQIIAELEGVSYSLSHDMRAPLRTIRSFSQIVLEEAESKLDPEHVGLLNKVINSAGRLDRLIQDVLVYSRVSRERVQVGRVDVEKLVRQIIEERPELQPPRTQIRVETPLAVVHGHDAYLTQCLTNLLDNAVKFVPKDRQPELRIWNEVRSRRVRIWVEDNGIGIPAESQERIFGIFQRVHDDVAYPGTGIGLAIVRKAVERMGGEVGVESEPGRGSRFWLELERAE